MNQHQPSRTCIRAKGQVRPNPSLEPRRYGRPRRPRSAQGLSCAARAARPAAAPVSARTLGLTKRTVAMPLLLAQAVVLFTLPALVACLSAGFSWHQLHRPWLYLGVSTLCLYVVYLTSMYFLSPKSVGYMVSGEPSREPVEPMPALMLLDPYKVPLLVFLVASVPVVIALLRVFKQSQ